MPLAAKYPAVALITLLCIVAATIASATSSVQGFVYTQDTNQPLVDVTVEVDGGCRQTYSCDSYSTTTSASDGSFAVTDVIAGNVTAYAYCPPTGCNFVRDMQTFTVSDGVTASQDFHLAPGATISGTVMRHSDNLPLAGIVLEVSVADNVNFRSDATTDGSGNYSFQQLPADSYAVTTDILASASESGIYDDQIYAGHMLTPPSQGAQVADNVTVGSAQSVNGIDFSLLVGGQITGTLTDRYTGAPLVDTPMNFSIVDTGAPQSEWLNRTAYTDASGRYELDGLPDATIYLGAYTDFPYHAESYYGCSPDPCNDLTHATALNVAAGTTQNIDLSLFPGSLIIGTVTRRADGQPIAGVTVTAYVNSGFSSQLVFGRATSDAQGNYFMPNGINGLAVSVSATQAHSGGSSYVSQVYDDHNCLQGSCAISGDMISPPAYQVTPGIDFQLDSGGAISGQVVYGDTGTGIQALIMLYASDASVSDRINTNADGTFTTSGLTAGTYYLSATTSSPSDCVIYPNVTCGQGYILDVGQPIVISGTQDVTGIQIAIPSDTLFANGFE